MALVICQLGKLAFTINEESQHAVNEAILVWCFVQVHSNQMVSTVVLVELSIICYQSYITNNCIYIDTLSYVYIENIIIVILLNILEYILIYIINIPSYNKSCM